MNEIPPEGIEPAPSPWLNLPISIWLLPFVSSTPLKDHAYAPLEAESAFADQSKNGMFKGGLGTLQVLRYHDSPIGPYDEILIVPGSFEVGEKLEKKRRMLRITRIYVSKAGSMWNGRKNWNIPKHLATFTFTTTPSGTQLALSPPNSTIPFLRINLTPFKYVPAIPFSTNSAKWVGLDLRLAQPPLPSASESKDATKIQEEEGVEFLCGTKEWQVAMPEIWGRAKGCWAIVDFDPSVSASETTALLSEAVEDVVKEEGEKGQWPAYRPWKVGVFIKDGRMNFDNVEVDGITK